MPHLVTDRRLDDMQRPEETEHRVRRRASLGDAGSDLAARDFLRGWTVLLYDTSEDETLMLREIVDELGGTLIRMGHVEEGMSFLDRHHDARIAIVIEADSDDLSATVDHCLALRRRHPRCPIILTSTTFAQNDYSTERMAICDTSLRSPISQVSFLVAVPAAIANNALYASRQAMLDLDHPPAAAAQPEAGPEPAPVAPQQSTRPRRRWSRWTARLTSLSGLYALIAIGAGLLLQS